MSTLNLKKAPNISTTALTSSSPLHFPRCRCRLRGPLIERCWLWVHWSLGCLECQRIRLRGSASTWASESGPPCMSRSTLSIPPDLQSLSLRGAGMLNSTNILVKVWEINTKWGRGSIFLDFIFAPLCLALDARYKMSSKSVKPPEVLNRKRQWQGFCWKTIKWKMSSSYE